MSTDLNAGSVIPAQVAIGMAEAFKAKHPGLTNSVYFGAKQLQALLDTGTPGLRMHFAVNEKGTETLVISPVDANGTSTFVDPLEIGATCPPYC